MNKDERFILKMVGWKVFSDLRKEIENCPNCKCDIPLSAKPCDKHNDLHWDLQEMKNILINFK